MVPQEPKVMKTVNAKPPCKEQSRVIYKFPFILEHTIQNNIENNQK